MSSIRSRSVTRSTASSCMSGPRSAFALRVGRGTSPLGPFLDKQGRDLNAFDPADQEYGNSFVLGDDAAQLVPGHPHIWQEGGRFFLGYDYRYEKVQGGDDEFEYVDYFGIRELHWVDGWPTIWKPIRLEFDADDFADQLGEPVRVMLLSLGEPGSIVAFDEITVTSQPIACPGDFDGDGEVNGADLSFILSTWNTTNESADLDGSGTVDGADLSVLLAAWGLPCGQ